MSHHIHQRLHDHFNQELRRCAPRDHGRRGKFRAVEMAVAGSVARGAAGAADAIKQVTPGPAKDLSNPTRATGIPLYGSAGKPDWRTCRQGPLAECWITGPLGLIAETDPAYMANMVQPVAAGGAADGTLDPTLADVYILANDGTTLRIRVENLIGDQQDPVNALYGWWLDAYVAAAAFARTGSNVLADLNWGFGRQTLLWLLGAGMFGSSLISVADLTMQMRNGWRAILSTGANVPAGVTPSHVYWFAGMNAQVDPATLLCRGPWGESQTYAYNDADARQYFPLGSIDCIAGGPAPMPLKFPQVSPSAPSAPSAPVTPAVLAPAVPAGPTIVLSVGESQSHGENPRKRITWNVTGAVKVEIAGGPGFGRQSVRFDPPNNFAEPEEWQGANGVFTLYATAANGAVSSQSVAPFASTTTQPNPAPVLTWADVAAKDDATPVTVGMLKAFSQAQIAGLV